jgi:hypothetical protein
LFYNSQETPNKQCLLKYNQNGFSTGVTDKKTRLKLEQFSFAFLVLFIGIFISFVQFMREKMHYYFEEQQNKVSLMENLARATAKVMDVIQKRVEQNKVSVVNEKVMVDSRELAGSSSTTKERGNVETNKNDLVEELH